MSSEVYAAKISVPAGGTTATSDGEHFGAVIAVVVDNNSGTGRAIGSLVDSNGMDILGNAVHTSTATEQQYEQTELGGTAVAGTITVEFTGGAIGGSGTADVYVYIAP
tara:strand:- start:958 stop:1281 length:324 start_codon:yes stop_codon:yes gene_type:complete